MHARFTLSFGLMTLAGLTAATEGGSIRVVGKAAAAEIVIASLRNLRRERSIFFIMFKDYILK
jgi:hypothetical protein